MTRQSRHPVSLLDTTWKPGIVLDRDGKPVIYRPPTWNDPDYVPKAKARASEAARKIPARTAQEIIAPEFRAHQNKGAK